MYNDRFGVIDTNNAGTKVKKFEYVELNDILNFDVSKLIQNGLEIK